MPLRLWGRAAGGDAVQEGGHVRGARGGGGTRAATAVAAALTTVRRLGADSGEERCRPVMGAEPY